MLIMLNSRSLASFRILPRTSNDFNLKEKRKTMFVVLYEYDGNILFYLGSNRLSFLQMQLLIVSKMVFGFRNLKWDKKILIELVFFAGFILLKHVNHYTSKACVIV